MEQRLAVQHETYIGHTAYSYRGNRQNPLAADKITEYEFYEKDIAKGGKLSVTDRVPSTLADVISEFVEELGDLPRLGEFLEILGLAVPTNSTAGGELPMPLTLKARTAGNRVYRGTSPSRVGELNDATFVEAADALGWLAEQVAASTGQPASAAELAGAILRAVRDEDLRFADIGADAITSLTVDGTRRRVKSQPGDVIAIPVDGGNRLALMITRDRRGMALGLFQGRLSTPRVGALDPASAKR